MSGAKLRTLQSFATLAARHGMGWVSLGVHSGWNDAAGSRGGPRRPGRRGLRGAEVASCGGLTARHGLPHAPARGALRT
ncbi:hypothetical protein ACPCDX_14320 [Streptomyces koyangensis]|uniref:hypothetical protein n=1 Tax=Streptomyces koyangensis TaxID=188770 RepID=UPI003C2EC5AF